MTRRSVWVRYGPTVCILTMLLAASAWAQYTPPSDQLVMSAAKAVTWDEGQTNVIQFEVPVSFELDLTRMTAKSAVVWLTPLEGALAGQHRVEIVLVGDAKLNQPNGIASESPRLSVNAQVRERVVLQAERIGGDRSRSDLYKQAKLLRRVPLKGGEPAGPWVVAEEPLVKTTPATRPAPYRPQQSM